MTRVLRYVPQRLRCIIGIHGDPKLWLKRTDQRVLVTTCKACGKVLSERRMTREGAKSVREISRRFAPTPLHD